MMKDTAVRNLALLQAYNTAWNAYLSYVHADPEMLAQTDEGKRLKYESDEAWKAYYNAAYKQHSRLRQRLGAGATATKEL